MALLAPPPDLLPRWHANFIGLAPSSIPQMAAAVQKMLADTRAKIEVFAERNGAWFVYPSPIHRQTPPQSLQGRPCLTSFLTTFSSLSPSTNIPASPLHPPRNQRPALHRYPHATRLLPLSSVPVTPSPTRLHSPSHASSPYLRTHHHSPCLSLTFFSSQSMSRRSPTWPASRPSSPWRA